MPTARAATEEDIAVTVRPHPTAEGLIPWPSDEAERYRAEGVWAGRTFDDVLRDSAAARPDADAVVDEVERWTYREFEARVDALAAGLADAGVAPGERVMVQLPNRSEFVQTVFALFRLGALPVFCLPAHREVELTGIARDSGAVALVTAHHHERTDHAAMGLAVQRAVEGLRLVVCLADRGSDAVPEGTVDFASLRAAPRAFPRADPSGLAFLQLSGGTTGVPKLIPRTHDDYLYSVVRSNEVCGVDRDTVFLAALPVAHNFPMSSPGILGALAAGGTVVLSPAPHPAAAFPLIAREGVTMTGLVPPLARLWTETAENGTDADLSSLDTLLVGGARCPDELAARIGPALGVRLQQVFGMAEGLVCYTRLDDPPEVALATQGRPMSPYDRVRVVDDAGREVPDGEPGHLVTSGPYTIRGYYRNPAADARSFTDDGWYITGDIVRRDAGGNLTVCGRATDHINRGGEKISAEELEEHLLAHPGIRDAVVVGVPDPFLGARTCAYVLASDGSAPPKATELRRFIRGRGLAAWKVLDTVEVLDAFPETGVGKTSRKELRELLLARG